MLEILACQFLGTMLCSKTRAPRTAGKKSRDLTASEFGTNLKTLITKKSAAAGKVITVQDFIQTLDGI